MFPPAALSKPLILNCSRLVRADYVATDPTGKSSITTQIATSSNDAVTLVDKVTLDVNSLKIQVLEPGSQKPVDYSSISDTLQVTDHWVFGRSYYYADPATPGDTSLLKIMKIVNIDRSSGAFSTTRQYFDHPGIKLISYTQFVGTCTKGARLF